MKKRIFMLLMTMVMMLGMSLTTFADETRYFEGEGDVDRQYAFGSNVGRQAALNPTLEIDGDMYRIRFTGATDQLDYDLLFQYGGEEYGNTNLIVKSIVIGGVDKQFSEGYIFPVKQTEDTVEIGMKVSDEYIYISLYMTFNEVYTQNSYQIATGFTGTAVSDRGDYNLYIAGYFSKDLTNGTHVLALNDITSQTIAVVAHNNANGVNRNMNQSTIEEMTVTVSGGVMTEMIIRGRVQTDGGTLDRYTATINP